eukprot:2374603-Rhodomonas_salina.1
MCYASEVYCRGFCTDVSGLVLRFVPGEAPDTHSVQRPEPLRRALGLTVARVRFVCETVSAVAGTSAKGGLVKLVSKTLKRQLVLKRWNCRVSNLYVLKAVCSETV